MNEPGRQKLSRHRRTVSMQAQHTKLYFDLLQPLSQGTFGSPGHPPEGGGRRGRGGFLISAYAVPNRGGIYTWKPLQTSNKQQKASRGKKNRNDRKDITIKYYYNQIGLSAVK